jgi:hypothetical protein
MRAAASNSATVFRIRSRSTVSSADAASAWLDAPSTSARSNEWVLLLDSDICFDLGALQRMFDKRPASENVGMMAAFTTEALFGRQIRSHPQFRDVRDDQIVTFNHYADTFAFVGPDSKNIRPKCAFAGCKMCNVNTYSKAAYADKKHLFDVKSCYNGFAIVDPDVLRNPRVAWDTIDIEGGHSLCEHVLFCASVLKATGKRVCVALDVDKVFWTNP